MMAMILGDCYICLTSYSLFPLELSLSLSTLYIPSSLSLSQSISISLFFSAPIELPSVFHNLPPITSFIYALFICLYTIFPVALLSPPSPAPPHQPPSPAWFLPRLPLVPPACHRLRRSWERLIIWMLFGGFGYCSILCGVRVGACKGLVDSRSPLSSLAWYLSCTLSRLNVHVVLVERICV